MPNFSKTWKSSKKPGKQRKYRVNAPFHIKRKFLSVHLSEELSKKYGKRAIVLRKGDKVKITKGQFKGKTGKIDQILTKKQKAFINGVEFQKKEGTKVRYPINVSNLVITEVELNDKKRQESIKRK